MSAAIVAAEHYDARGTQLPHLSKGVLLVWHAPNSAKITPQSEYAIWLMNRVAVPAGVVRKRPAVLRMFTKAC
jgi:hypothetical protein